MDMTEAYELARYVLAWLDDAKIGAIGRFKPLDQLQADDPWGVSVLVPGDERPKVLWSSSDFDLLMTAQAAKLRVQLVPVRTQGVTNTPTSEGSLQTAGIPAGQGLLF